MQYFEPNFLGEALVLLERFGSSARILAGGTLLGFEAREHPEKISALINIKRIDELSRIVATDGTLEIGPLATAATLAGDTRVQTNLAVLASAAASMGAPQLRTMATVGGNVCGGDAASDLSAALLACDAVCEVATSEARSTVPIGDLLPKGRPVLAPNALLTRIAIPLLPQRSAYAKMTTRRGLEMAIVAVAFCARFENGVLRDPRIALAGAGPTPLRALAGERTLDGKAPTLQLRHAAAQVAATQDAQPGADSRASQEYRRHLVSVLTGRAIAMACEAA